MTFIDWTDAEGLFGLLLDYVADERAACTDDPERRRFLSGLLSQLRVVEAELPEIPAAVMIRKLRDIYESTGAAFAGDPVVVHLDDCIEALDM